MGRTGRRRRAGAALAGPILLLSLLTGCHGPAAGLPVDRSPAATTSAVVAPSPAGSPATLPGSPTPAATGPRAATTSVHWASCADPDLRRAGAQCGTVSVPLDYAHPAGTRITLAVSRVRHNVPAAQYLGVMLTNPGGPGASGLLLATAGANVPASVGARYDWIGIDPRGVGASRPRVTCDDTITTFDRPDYRATTAALQRYWLDRSRTYAEDCAARNGTLLAHLSTEDSARDLDSVRAALGVAKVSYYGFSAGTYLGEIYATLFPQRLNRMVLDSTVDPRQVWYAAQLAQDVAFQQTADRFYGWVAHYQAVYHLGATVAQVRHRYEAELNFLALHPAQGEVGPDELTDIVSLAAYYQSEWPGVAQAWAALVHHDAVAGLVDLGLGPADDNEYAIYHAVECSDVAWPRSYARWRADAVATARRAPFLTWDNVWYNASCLFWPVPAGVPVTPHLTAAPPTLLVDETLDSATPYAGSLYVRSIFPASRLLAIAGGVSHASSLQGYPCEDDRIAAYLSAGTLPARRPGSGADAVCPAPPAPAP